MKRIVLTSAFVLSLAAPTFAEDAAEFNLLIVAASKGTQEQSYNFAGTSVSASDGITAQSLYFESLQGYKPADFFKQHVE
ncbi:hypothetical protein ACFFUT_02645 [Pseudohalocynthiibacter aestuariivivens]|uniref:Uncharacterized protein n=1 Tax=Pseudohalocynthiibacter aestuariivivens TaxID=1591409 RepID=A0ABV5JB85_9RHOB|nr:MULTISPECIES: hypothetical protein [Pseudohalocynthiibacter]MBS9715760.1 hypothetical protein [Pseudohalocynthiibacter aestuariivivens]MCK0101373.1 hypothetical protein [Pseudohalocynthiibacter sp. F2068]